ncbi:MAG: HAD family hydrolase, partial [Chloroflexota bacterium]
FYLHVCRQLGASPEEVLHVGDNRQFDYLFPRQVGIQAFHLDRKAETGQEQHTLGSLTELKSLLSRARLNTARAGTKAPGKASA